LQNRRRRLSEDVRHASLLKRLLGGLNAILAGGTLACTVVVLLRPSEVQLDLRPEEEIPRLLLRVRDEGDGVLRALSNPIEPRAARPAEPSAPAFRAVLKGTLTGGGNPPRGVAFIKSLARNAELVAYVGEEIRRDGRPDDEFRGWTLASVGKDSAVFVNTRGERLELSIDPTSAPTPGAAPPPPGPRAPAPGKAYSAESYRSRLLASADNRQIWGLDPDEIDWAAQNVQEILDRDLQVAPYVGGGLRLEGVPPESIGAARGLLPGDVVREVNGHPLQTTGDLRALLDNPTTAAPGGLRLTIERAGKAMILEYRPLAR
jgi:hypothetical protein